jgi:hypothetical protein
MSPLLILLLAVGLVLAVGVAVLSMRAARQSGSMSGGAGSTVVGAGGAPVRKWGAVESWQEIGAPLEALGLSKLNAECYWRQLAGLSETLYLSLDVKGASVTGRLERPCPGAAIEQLIGETSELSPGKKGRSALDHFVAGAVGELFASLPRDASLSVTAPEIPSAKYKLLLRTPFTAPEQASVAVRVLLALDEAARAPSPEGAHAKLSPLAARWAEAASSLEALGLTKLNAECYWRQLAGLSETLYLSLDVKEAAITGRLERPCPGGAIEQFVGESAEARPGHEGRSELAHFVARAARESLSGLPEDAVLSVKAPDIPGDKYRLLLTTPFVAPGHAAAVVRVLLALDEAARAASPQGALATLSPVAARWQQAGAMLEALGMKKLDAECYWQTSHLFVNVNVAEITVTGRLSRTCPGGALERLLGQTAELRPGERARSELAQITANAVGELLAALPQQARLAVKAPEIPGDNYTLTLTTPFAAPEHAACVARVLLAFEAAAH